jgi:hypothetical protein
MRRLVLVVPLLLTGCAALAIATAPAKRPGPSSPEAKAVATRFWDALHGGRYAEIDDLLEAHLQQVVAAPEDVVTVSHVGWLHAWKLAERTREPARASVISHATLARRYFDEAVALDPGEARYLGFAASFTMAEASILKDERLLRQGYFQMKEAVARWPQFNLFTSGYSMASNPPASAPFREGLEQQWQTLDVCFGVTVSRQAPRFEAYLPQETREGPARACWNSWIAPHNWEGFFLNFGDMLVRAGDPTNARAMYEATRLSRTYAAWPYREVLEQRLAGLADLAAAFTAPDSRVHPMAGSAFTCMACHQERGPPAAVASRSE